MLASKQASTMLLIDKVIGPSTFAVSPDTGEAGSTIIDRIAGSMRLHEFEKSH